MDNPTYTGQPITVWTGGDNVPAIFLRRAGTKLVVWMYHCEQTVAPSQVTIPPRAALDVQDNKEVNSYHGRGFVLPSKADTGVSLFSGHLPLVDFRQGTVDLSIVIIKKGARWIVYIPGKHKIYADNVDEALREIHTNT